MRVPRLWLLFWLGWAGLAGAAGELTVRERLKSCDTGMAIAAAEQIIRSPESLREPLEMFTPAAVLFLNGQRDEAVFWFYAAQLRTRYQLLFEQGDREPVLARMLSTVGPPINNYAYQDVDKLNSILDRVFEWDERTPNPWRRSEDAARKQQEIDQLYRGFRVLQDKLSAQKDDIEARASQAAPAIQQAYAARREKLCAAGRPDPAYAERTIDAEWQQVLAYVKTEETIVSASGRLRKVAAESYLAGPDEVLPYRYIVAVEGDARQFSAVVDVLRDASARVEFSLICLTETERSRRDPGRDACAQ